MKRDLVRQYKKGSELDSFFALLPAAKQRRVEAYTQVPKVAEWLAQRREVVAWLQHTDSRGSGLWLNHTGAGV